MGKSQKEIVEMPAKLMEYFVPKRVKMHLTNNLNTSVDSGFVFLVHQNKKAHLAMSEQSNRNSVVLKNVDFPENMSVLFAFESEIAFDNDLKFYDNSVNKD